MDLACKLPAQHTSARGPNAVAPGGGHLQTTQVRRGFLVVVAIATFNLFSITHAFAGCGEPTGHTASHPVLRPSNFLFEGDETPGEPIVGLWQITVTNPQLGVIQRGFDAFHSDHTEVLNEFHDPRTGNVCLGVWTQAGSRTYKLLHPAFWWDANGNWIGYRVLRETVTVDTEG